ncbi:MAG: efflux RND transporter permease subunit [Planctomycetia bacterium]|nr:efflux RND transporter permease subunit [Planctomycetia bacterium]
MIERMIEFSIRNRFLVLAIALGLTMAGIVAVFNTPVDAIPDLSENQVIVFTDWMGRSPREIEDQVTYPLSRKLQGLAGVRAVRSSSEFNFSMITIIFDDNIGFYFASERVTEKLGQAATYLPAGVVPYLAPDATALGQVFWYTVESSPENPIDPARLWALNKFYIAPQLNAAPGVSDVATVGGTPLEYQIDVRPEALRAYGITLGELYAAVEKSNMPAGGGVIQKNNAEYIVRGVGWIKDKTDIENTVIREAAGTPIYIKSIANVQLGTQFRRSVYEKDGNEVVGGAVLMRHGENPLAVTERIKAKIQDLQPGLPAGVHIVAAYDRTRLIRGAIHTLADVMSHEMIIASLAILLILTHVRSVFVICVTLPLSVLFSFLLMWVLRRLGIVDIQANIMSLAGITISIGILVDQAIVMTENATHHLKAHFGDRKVAGNISELVIEPCRTVGRPIFFSVLIMLLSFVPVFMLSGREGKYFHPLAFTKSFAMLGVAIISVTVVPALIPLFLRGRLRGEEDNVIVRSFINIYKPLLTWALPRRNLVMWAFAALLVLAAGIFPLQAILGMGASERAWKITFLAVFAAVTFLTVVFTQTFRWQALSLASLVLMGLWAFHFPKIGVAFMPALDEGTTLDMPITVPRASVTQAADDLKARDALLRGFPEVESVIGKAGRADTPTDPAPLDMVETFVNFRPKELWPKRVLRFPDAEREIREVLRTLQAGKYIKPALSPDESAGLVNDVSQKAVERFDETMRELALIRYRDFERELGPRLTRFAITHAVERMIAAGDLHWSKGEDEESFVTTLASKLTPKYGTWLAKHPALEDLTQLNRDVATTLQDEGLLDDVVSSLREKPSLVGRFVAAIREALGAERPTFAGRSLEAIEEERMALWRAHVHETNWELFDRGCEAFTWYALQELCKAAKTTGLLGHGQPGKQAEQLAAAAVRDQQGKTIDPLAFGAFTPMREQLEKAFRQRVFFWPRRAGPKGDLVDDEMGRVLQIPGWSNIFTQPIINRIEMLSTGVRTDIGVKVFGPDLDTIDRVGKQIEAVLKPLSGARDVVAAPIMGKGYLQIDIDRQRAARYGISVEDIQNEIEVALAGRAVTYTVEKRERFPVRIRYARAERQDEENIRRLLIGGTGKSGSSMAQGAANSNSPAKMGATAATSSVSSNSNFEHVAVPAHAAQGAPLIPLSAVADLKIVEGPAMIKSENGELLNYVTLNVRGRDIGGFVDEAQRVVAQKVALSEGVHIEWSGEFEHQVRAARTLCFVLPIVVILIFTILYLTYNDLADAALMILAVPEALAGGAFFMFLFPKITHGWATPPLDFSVAVWVGFIACFGMATETGIIMLVYLREAIEKRGGLANLKSLEELRQAVIEGAVHRLRPKLLTEGVAIIAIFPMVFATGVGGEILAPMALPVLGGLLISDEVVDLFLPVRFYWVRRRRWLQLQREKKLAAASAGDTIPMLVVCR